MTAALWICRVITAAIFAVSGIAKLVHPSGTRRALVQFGVPAPLTPIGAVLLPLAELVTCAALLWNVTAWWGAVAAVSLFALFSVVIAATLMRGENPDCHCFGKIGAQPISGSMIVRNALLAAPAMFIVLAPYTLIVEALLAIACIVLATGLAYALFSLRKLGESVRVMERLFDANDGATHRHTNESATAAPAASLPIGAIAPDFALLTSRGEQLTLSMLQSRGKPVVVWFGSPTCGPCKELVPDIARWPERLGERYSIVGLLRGTAEENALVVREHRALELAFTGDSGVAEAYRAQWTPGAVVISAEGRIASETAFGVDAIRALIERLASLESLAPARSMPELRAIAPDGSEVASGTLWARGMTVVLFWSTTCPYCTAMVEDLEQWARARPARSSELLLVHAGAEAPAQTFGAPVVLDTDGSIGRELLSAGTPSAFLVDSSGAIVSAIVIGGADVRALLGIGAGAR